MQHVLKIHEFQYLNATCLKHGKIWEFCLVGERDLFYSSLPSPLDGNICVLNFVCFWYYCWYCVQANIGQKVGQFRRIQVAAVRLSPTTRKTGTRGILHICHGRHQRNCICLDFLNLIQWFTVEKKTRAKSFWRNWQYEAE